VVDASRNAEQAHNEQQRQAWHRTDERAALRLRIPGNLPPSRVEANAAAWRRHLEQSRSDLAEIEALPLIEAAQLIRDRAARTEAERVVAERAKTARDARAAQLARFHTPSIDHGRPGPGRDGIGM
jgi:hypothetical protein